MGCLFSHKSSKTETTSVTSSRQEEDRQPDGITRHQYVHQSNGAIPRSNIEYFVSNIPTQTAQSLSQIRNYSKNWDNRTSILPSNDKPSRPTSILTSNVRPSRRTSILPSNDRPSRPTSILPSNDRPSRPTSILPSNVRPSRPTLTRPNASQNIRHLSNQDHSSRIGTVNVLGQIPSESAFTSDEVDSDVTCGYKKLYPSQIRYIQDSIKSTFYEKGPHGGKMIGITLDELLTGKTKIEDIPRIRVCCYKNHWFSCDNRRLWVFKKYESIKGPIQISVKVVSCIDEDKFTTENDGTSIRVRRDPGGSYWRRYKNGR